MLVLVLLLLWLMLLLLVLLLLLVVVVVVLVVMFICVGNDVALCVVGCVVVGVAVGWRRCVRW